MSKQLNFASKIRALKTGTSFTVKTETERQEASRAGKTLKKAGVIEFDIVTKANEGGGFKVAAI